MAELEAALRDATLDSQEIDRLTREYGELQVKDIRSRISSVMAVRNTLTPQQVTNLNQPSPSDEE